jgi:hypothetical protein
MRQMISGMVAAIAVVAASAVPAMACGYGGCSPCGQISPCVQPQVYVSPVAPVYNNYSGCDYGCGWARERLPDPVQQYYYVNQGPTYTGPGNWAPRPVYQEGALPTYYGYRGYRSYRPRVGYYAPRVNYRYGYAPRRAYYAARYAPHRYYGHRPLRRYY